MNRPKVLRISLLAVAIGLISNVAQAQQIKLRMLTSWVHAFDYTPIVAGEFKKLVEQKSKGRISIELQGPEVVPPFQQFGPLKNGLFDLLFTTAAYHANSIAIGLMGDAIDPDPVKFRDSGAFAIEADRYLKKANVKLLAIASGSDDAFQLLLRSPVDSKTNLQGRKIRGTPNYNGVIDALGGTPVVLPITQTYTALQKGVVDGAGVATIGVIHQHWNEVVKYVGRPAMGSMRLPILMNMASWNRLSKNDHQLMLEAGREVEISAHKAANDLKTAEDAKLAKLGMKETEFGLSKATIEQKWEQGLWKLTAKYSPETVQVWQNFLKGKKLLRSQIY